MRPTRLRVSDLRNVYLLVGECRELGDDPIVWRGHLSASVARLVSAEIIGGGEMAGGHRGPPRILGNVDWGWEQGFDREAWLRTIEWFNEDPYRERAIGALLRKLKTRTEVTLPRQHLVDDDNWYGSEAYSAIQEVGGVDALMYSFRHIPGTHDDFSAIMMNREAGKRNFNERECQLIGYLHQELRRAFHAAADSTPRLNV